MFKEEWIDVKLHPIRLASGMHLFTVELEEFGEITRMTLPGLLTRNKNFPNGWQICTYGYSYVFYNTEEKTDTGCRRILAYREMPAPYNM